MLKNENSLPPFAGNFDFTESALALFRHQFDHNAIYRAWADQLGVRSQDVKEIRHIPFLPVGFFKTHDVVTGKVNDEAVVFTSSGTTGTVASRHIVTDPGLYRASFEACFRRFYGDPTEYCILALLPGYLERTGSSLVYMADQLIRLSGHPQSGFYLREMERLSALLKKVSGTTQKVLLLGVSYALLDLCEYDLQLGDNIIVMETGGMKGTRREMLKSELHAALKKGLGVAAIHSEYGMTELLSQAYSRGDGLFECPPWMRFLLRETDDPLAIMEGRRTGGVNVIDLANRNSCAFIATQDLGRMHPGKRLELMGRFDHSDIRGCNLMMQEI